MIEYERALPFWNGFYENDGEDGEKGGSLGCSVLEEQLRVLASKKRVLDFGCGSGWASLFMAENGGAEIVALDQAQNAITAAAKSAERLGLSSANFICGTDAVLKTYADGSFDGFFSSNVLDVVPGELCFSVLGEVRRLMAKGAVLAVMLNPYADEALREKLGMTEIIPGSYAIDGVLRIVNRTKEEWEALFGQFFRVVSYREFRFDDEPEDRKRWLFILEKQA